MNWNDKLGVLVPDQILKKRSNFLATGVSMNPKEMDSIRILHSPFQNTA